MKTLATLLTVITSASVLSGFSQDKVEIETIVSSIADFSYNPATHVFTADFENGTYEYAGVPQAVFDQIEVADSAGSAFNFLIKGSFESSQVSG